MSLGQLSLNLSFLIYLILYLPQIIHNQRQSNLDGLSKWTHILLYTAYSMDLIYGITTHLPWQYCTVSTIGWVLLNVQHLQITCHFKQKQQHGTKYSYLGLWIASIVLVFHAIYQQPFSLQFVNYLGYAAQLGFIFALMPQVVKSKKLQSALAINFIYILLNSFIACLDLISAWKLEWGWPNKLGSMFILSLSMVLLVQRYTYRRLA